MKRLLPFAIIVLALGGALLLVMYFRQSADWTARKPTQSPSAKQNQPNSVKLGADPPHALGAVDAPVLIEEFGDFECPPCGLLHPILKSMKAEFGPRLVIVFRQFPMVSLHRHAMAAARASEAAGLQGKFWEMYDLLYENQQTWHEASDAGPIFEQYAVRIGLDLDRFKLDAAGQVVNQRISLDRERGAWIGVQGTPTLFLNGREVQLESLTPERLRTLINSELQKR